MVPLVSVSSAFAGDLGRSVVWGQTALPNMMAGAIVIILTLYLILDRKSM
ncbi:MAG: hypothetical protein SF187_04545 [Deltaproteobacteria bacterium]|nr:hypothetical protein [Deltaproteobacteria bacterium]